MKNFWQTIPHPVLALAPMAGVTDAAFRQMCKQHGADVIYTEFASANALAYGNAKTFEMLTFSEEERPIICQIFGQEPSMMCKAASRVRELGFDGVDINFGCPAYKVTKHGGGVCLMRNLPVIRSLVEATLEGAGDMPVSIKIRGSIKSEDKKHTITASDLVETIKDLPVAALMVHGRSYEKPFDGEPNTEEITSVVKSFSGIVLANGGITSPEKAKDMLEKTGAAGIGIARGAWGAPWIFSQTKDFLQTGSYTNKTPSDITHAMLEHAKRAFACKGSHGIMELRKHLSWYVRGWPHAAELRKQLVLAKSEQEIAQILSA